ncbi:ABC transporter permease [Paraburkholderia sp. JPY432]|uniref:ABC transporter permease n=1 Tax=Paraburkholderia youngii TaxID=2782701 RepID=UPI001594F6ED|nr:ABC transporter permease [Paraburkholderia youngii]NVH76679.1 ABC transporter permease [Paraburkholderia youngii]
MLFTGLRGLARRASVLLWWVSPALLFLLWWYVSVRHWFAPQLVVPPQKVFTTLNALAAGGDLWDNLQITCRRLAIGFVWGSVTGVACGALLALSRTFSDYVRPLFDVLRQVPTLTLIPVLILLIGIDESLKVVVVAKAVFFPVALATYGGVEGVPRDLVEMARHYGLGRAALFRDVLLPSAIPSLLTGIRIAIARAWLSLVAVELLSADSGIGEMMEMARQMLRIDVVLVDVILIGLIGFVLDQSVALVQRCVLRWQISPR